MYHRGGMMELPVGTARIWRYMDLTKLLSLIDSKSLFFASLVSFEDPFEGFLPLPTFEQYRDQRLYEEGYAGVQPDQVRGLYDSDKKTAIESRKALFVNCWHKNDYESAAMWKLYLSSAEGVAVQSTVDRLIRCFRRTEESILVGNVKYIDYEKEVVPNNVFCRAILKRKSFEHEKELCAVYYDKELALALERNVGPSGPPAHGKSIPIDVDVLIDKIYLAPTSPNWLRPLVLSIVSKLGLSKDVVQSSLRDGPIW
jgi:hypothetical protein